MANAVDNLTRPNTAQDCRPVRYQLLRFQACRQQGFSLLEVSIASLVFAIGLLGVAAMQRLSAQQANQNFWQAQALQLSVDYQERIKSNYVESNTGLYVVSGSVNDPGYDCIFNYGNNDTDFACSSQQIAAVDKYALSEAVERVLPNGQVLASLTADGTYAITIAWVDPASGDAHQYNAQFLP